VHECDDPETRDKLATTPDSNFTATMKTRI